MEPTEKELDALLAKTSLHVPADFAQQVMRRVERLPSPVSPVTWRSRLQALSKRRIGILSLPQLLAFVFGIMLTTAAG